MTKASALAPNGFGPHVPAQMGWVLSQLLRIKNQGHTHSFNPPLLTRRLVLLSASACNECHRVSGDVTSQVCRHMMLIRFQTHLLGEMSQVITSVLEHAVSLKKGVRGARHLKVGIWTERTQYLHKHSTKVTLSSREFNDKHDFVSLIMVTPVWPVNT